MIKIVGISLITIVLTLILKQYKPEFALICSVAGGLIILVSIIEPAKALLDNLISINYSGFNASDYLKPVLKVVAIGLLTEFGASLSADNGLSYLGAKIYLAGKISILVTIMPTLIKALNLVLGLL